MSCLKQPFLQKIWDHPGDLLRPLIYADWLEEQGDETCEEIRKWVADVENPPAVAIDDVPATLSRISRLQTLAFMADLISESIPFNSGMIMQDDEFVRAAESVRRGKDWPRRDEVASRADIAGAEAEWCPCHASRASRTLGERALNATRELAWLKNFGTPDNWSSCFDDDIPHTAVGEVWVIAESYRLFGFNALESRFEMEGEECPA